MELFDSHAHLDDEKFDEDREILMKEIRKAGITKLISAGYSLEGSRRGKELAEKYDFIYTTAGISPNDIPQTQEELWIMLEEIEAIAKQSGKVVAIGEIGLDYYWNDENKELQKLAFEKQIEIANRLELPIVIHTREAVMDTLAILKQREVLKKGVFHCCPLNRELVKEALKLGFYISFAGPITFKNAKNADEIVELVPMDRMVIETDCPYLSPEPNRGKRNDSGNLRYIVEKIATVKQVTKEEVAKITYQNACNLFHIKNKEQL